MPSQAKFASNVKNLANEAKAFSALQDQSNRSKIVVYTALYKGKPYRYTVVYLKRKIGRRLLKPHIN